jgi:hypothetical protein
MDDFFPSKDFAEALIIKRRPGLPASYEYLISGALETSVYS